MKTIAFFNNKAGVGKTSLVYHLSWMLADLGVSVVEADLDPQANLTSSFLEDDALESLWLREESPDTILGAIQPLLDRLGNIAEVAVRDVDPNIGLIPGDLGLSLFEDRLATTWPACLDDDKADAADALRVASAFHRIIERAGRARNADLALVDLGPNLGAINRAALAASDFVVVPLAADLHSLIGLRHLGRTLDDWREGWETRKATARKWSLPPLPDGGMRPLGYVVTPPSARDNHPMNTHRRWIGKIPDVYRRWILDQPPGSPTPDPDPQMLATLRNFRSLAPMAQEKNKPMFHLKPADGAIGGHALAVKDCGRAFRDLALKIAAACGVEAREAAWNP